MTETLLKTALYDKHIASGGQMGEEGGWAMPLHFGSGLEEATQVRSRAGLFDVSHLGRLRIRGDGALDLLERLCTADVAHQEDDTTIHTLLCNDSGGILDECYLIRLQNFWVLTTNAINREKILAHLKAHGEEIGDVKIDDQTNKVSQLAAVGPEAERILDAVMPISIAGLKSGEARTGSLMIANYIASRSSYCGRLYSLEVMIPTMFAGKAWDYVTGKSGDNAMKPAGIMARDILRIEAGLCKFGHEINEMTNPAAAGLMSCVDFGHDFIGAEAVREFEDKGSSRIRTGLILEPPSDGRSPTSIPTLGATISTTDGREVGNVTSATFSPHLEKIIAQGYIVPDAIQSELLVQTADNPTAATAEPLQ